MVREENNDVADTVTLEIGEGGVSTVFIFATSINGKIKAWLYDSLGSRVEYDAPGLWCTMAYSTDGKRTNSQQLITKALVTLVNGLETKFDIEMVAMTRVPWATLEIVGDQSD
ncbi:hypothetical protein L2E82_01406 [Cichorium intybus]|uniref:Uncharacterized protein n=1 Tax=Cichorium intybus TaxID=13427 RepID=A0ACB9GYG0_CICIN|nr:hypothetical protein L2E82_01406 [Cichorium intybus]